MRYVCLFALLLPVLPAQDGAAIYKERCAKCHDMPAARVPSLTAIKEMSAEAVYVALSNGAMKTEAAGLSTAEIFSLIGYIGPAGTHAAATTFTTTCKGDAPFHASAGVPEWNGWSPSVTNSRFQDAAGAQLTASDVGKLKLKWAFNLGDVTVARSQPAVASGRVFIGTGTSAVYALDADSGCTRWGFQAAPGGIRSGVTVGHANGDPAVFFGDASATMYALNAQTGVLIWKVRPVDHFASTITGTARYYKGVVYQPIASFEEALGGDPKTQCCTFRGSVVALDAGTGKKLWQTFTIAEAPKPTRKSVSGTQQFGPSGASVWSSPTIDEKLGALYVATGDNYSDPPTGTSDAILAMDLKTGALLWSKQLTANDAYNVGCAVPVPGNCPESKGPDYDFGQPPILVSLGAGKRALVIGQKSGMVHAIDPDQKGKILWQTRAGEGSALGGSQWGSAADERNVYVAISNIGIGGAPDPKSPQGFRLTLDPKKGGGLHAIGLNTGKIVWTAKPAPCADGRTDCSPAQSAAVTAIPGVVFSGSVDGHLRAYSASTGEILWDTDTEREFETVNGKPAHGGSLDAAGPAVINGMLFVNSGYGQWGGMPGNVFLAFSVDGK
ncbi:MAG TPA: PQQ-binding-like beta-propeller repeat protein [Bryobacteraceae bacterium]|nr:PQQ-binding-like beta-propeller repeat protein [Bryobacteraceae bacterium]